MYFPPGIDMFIAFNASVNFFELPGVVVVIYDANDTQTGIVFPRRAPHANAQLALMVIKLWQFVCVPHEEEEWPRSWLERRGNALVFI